jgi:hypothetical protein
MMMHMLEAGGMPVLTDSIRKADEDNPNGYYEFEPVKRLSRDASWLVEAYGKVVKMVYLLLYDLPKDYDYRVIFMKRKLEEVIVSQNTMLHRQGKQSGALDDVQLVKVFHEHLQKLHAWLQDQDNFTVLYVNYNDILSYPESTVTEVHRFLGYGLDTEAMIKVVDPLLYRQRR